MIGAQPEATPEVAPRRRSGWRILFRLTLYLMLLCSLLVVAAGIAAYVAYDYVTRPGVPGDTVDLDVPAGATGRQVGDLLAEKGLVEHELFFRAAIKIDQRRGNTGTIKSGPYRIPQGLSPLELLHLLYEGPNRPLNPEDLPPDQKITIPEGLTIKQMAAFFDHPDAFEEAAHDPVLIERVGAKGNSLEGYLMPNTYYFFDGKPTEREVVVRMVDQFEREYVRLLQEFPQAESRDRFEVVTVASLIEEEGRVENERPLIAAVIYNRLAKGMPLQLDSTLQYALNKYGQRLLNADKETDSPYNTYKHAELPPGPISNPGPASLRAALQPADVSYLYFVSNADGATHTFSTTGAEHERAVRKYRREIAAQRRALTKEEQAQ